MGPNEDPIGIRVTLEARWHPLEYRSTYHQRTPAMRIYSLIRPTALAAAAALALPTASAQIYSTDFRSAADWTIVDGCGTPSVRWDADASPSYFAPGAFRSPPSSLNYNDGQGLPWGLACGSATSPAIQLAGTSNPVLQFWYAWEHELGCDWDAFSVSVIELSTGIERIDECLSFTGTGYREWTLWSRGLDPAWGTVAVRFTHDTLDGWNLGEPGSFVDDLVVRELCEGGITFCFGEPRFDGSPGASLVAVGSTSVTSSNFGLAGSGYPNNTFAAAFAANAPGIIPGGNGIRCVGASGSVRLGIAPTRDFGEPLWTLDLSGATLGGIAMAGSSLYIQTIYRDGPTFNFSDAVRVNVCD